MIGEKSFVLGRLLSRGVPAFTMCSLKCEHTVDIQDTHWGGYYFQEEPPRYA